MMGESIAPDLNLLAVKRAGALIRQPGSLLIRVLSMELLQWVE